LVKIQTLKYEKVELHKEIHKLKTAQWKLPRKIAQQAEEIAELRKQLLEYQEREA